MQVTVYKTVDIETEAVVSVDDILAEVSNRIEGAEPAYWRRMAEGLGTVLQVAMKLDQKVIDSIPANWRRTFSEKMAEVAKRFAVPESEAHDE